MKYSDMSSQFLNRKTLQVMQNRQLAEGPTRFTLRGNREEYFYLIYYLAQYSLSGLTKCNFR